MSAPTILPASETSMEMLCETMLDAFSDYAIPLQLSTKQFADMMCQRGLDLASSRIALVEGQVAAIWLTAIRDNRAYLISSGTRPAHRSKGLARAMATSNLAHLKKVGVRSFQTEVLRNNDTAEALYRSLGMTRHRQLDCYSLSAPDHVEPPKFQFKQTTWDEIAPKAQALLEWEPSWQNDRHALSALPEQVACLSLLDGSDLIAFAALQSQTGTVQQIAVHRSARRAGIASALVAALQTQMPGRAMRFINICDSDPAFRQWVSHMGAQEMIGQYELRMSL